MPEHQAFSEYPASERIQAIRAEVLAAPYSICLERPRLMRRFSAAPEGRKVRGAHPLIRRASLLAYVLAHRRPRIWPGELIMGNMTSKRVAANYYPEGGSINILEDLFRLERRHVPLKLSLREKAELLHLGLAALPDSVGAKALLIPGRFSYFLDFFRARRYFVTEEAGIAHQVGNYREVVHHGLCRADEIAKRCIDSGTRPDGTPLDKNNEAFYRSVGIVIDGIRAMATRLSEEARRLSMQTDISEERRGELVESAEACLQVPYRPARTFLEGLQSCWLVHVALNLEDFEQGLSFGRLDQILYPLFDADIREGRLAREHAVELLASFHLKTCETLPLYSERIDHYFSGLGVAQGITLGGVDASGADTSNELSGLILDAYAQVRTREPALHVRLHEATPPGLLDKAAATVQLGCGKPSFFGDRAVISALEGAGITTAHARDYAVIGCVEMASQGRTYNSSDAALFNLPLCLELALNQGRPFTDAGFLRRRLGAATPPTERMQSFDDFVQAFRTQVRHAMADMAKVIGWLEAAYRIWRPTPVNSVITEGCLDKGMDVTWGGAMYDFTSIQAVGLAETGDSLYALKSLVFDDRRYSLDQLVRILKADFAGYEALQAELSRKFPRYGNGDPRADRMTQMAADIFSEAVREHSNSRGGRYIPGIYSMTCFIAFGRHTGALPNGRSAGRPLSNGLSPAAGAERLGPTAILNSAASLDSSQWANCGALNIKLDKASVQGDKGRGLISSLLAGYVAQGGMQVQINVLDADVLAAAKADPGAHPDIVVRVAGYCAYFKDLQPEVQDEIIARTSHRLQ